MAFLASLVPGLLGGNKKTSTPDAPTFQADPLVGQTDTSLFNFGSDVLKGILPSSYQDLLQNNSPEFQSVLQNTNRDIASAGMNTAALQGNARSGAAQAGITSAVANNTANMRYNDLLNTQLNQKALLGVGLDSEQAAGNIALGNQGQINSFNSNIYGTQSNFDLGALGLSQKAQQATGAGIGSAFQGALSGIPYLSGLGGGSSSTNSDTGLGSEEDQMATGNQSQQLQQLMQFAALAAAAG